MITHNSVKIKNFPILGIGPMSKNCVDAIIEFSNERNFPMMLIASRRQIESNKLGSGYVNNWSTEQFSKYVFKKDKKKKIILCRDHGGPWQNENDKKLKLNLTNAMTSAKKSFMSDIDNNFSFIHIDTSEDPNKKLSNNDKLNRIYELYEFCMNYAKKNKKQIFIEINFGKEDGGIDSPKILSKNLEKIQKFCQEKKFPLPTFVVVRNGNHVQEMKNNGKFEKIFQKKQISNQKKILDCIRICKKFNIMSKIHNADYLSNYSIKLHKKIGVSGINIAPEFGVLETISFLKILDEYKLIKFKKEFISLSYSSKKWKKWLIPHLDITKFEKAIIAGHYVFSTPEFIKIKKKSEKIIGKNIDRILKEEIKKSLYRYFDLLYNNA